MHENSEYAKRIRDIHSEITMFDSRIEVQVFAGSLGEEHVKRIISTVQQVAGDSRYPILVLPDEKTKISFFAVKALASDEAMNYATATAYIIRSFHHQVMADALFSMYAPSRPLRVFKEENSARKWLQTFAA